MIVVACVTMALVVALSVFNGLENLIRTLYNTFDPEIKIVATKGKSFEFDEVFLDKIKAVEGVDIVTEVIEDNALLKYKEDQMVVKVKGVSDNFIQQSRMDSMIVAGEFRLHKGRKDYAIIGRGIQYMMSISLSNELHPLQLWYPKDLQKSFTSFNPDKIFNREVIFPGAVFAIEKQYDDNYIFVPLAFAQDLFNYDNKRTSLEIKTKQGYKINKVRDKLRTVLGSDFKVLNSDEQHASLLRAVKIEKMFMHLTITFILAVASFNIFFCLNMLAINKRKDVAILYSMGATPSFIRRIFLFEGAIIAFSGAIIGLILGVSIVLAQDYFGFASMGMETSIVDAYPVKMELMDFTTTGISIVIITIVASILPAIKASQVEIKDNL